MRVRSLWRSAVGVSASAFFVAFAHAGAVAQTGPIPFKAATDIEAPGLGRWFVAIGVCAAVLAMVLVWLRRRGTFATGALPVVSNRQLRVLQRVPLASGAVLVCVQYGGRQLLLSATAAQVACLRDDPVADGSPRGTDQTGQP
jgi:flagellar biogenesis protein FliO